MSVAPGFSPAQSLRASTVLSFQDLAVLLIVGAALFFLVRRIVGRRRRRHQPAQTFVPLSSIRKRGDGGCH